MSMNSQDFIRPIELPWTVNEEDEKRYKRILLILLLLFLITSVVVTSITLPELSRQEERQIQAQVTKVIEKKKVEPPKPKPKLEQKRKKPKPVEPQKTKTKASKAKAKANAKKRFSQVSDELSGMKSSLNLASIHASKNISSGGRIGLKGSRAIITSKNASGTSGGIVTANVSRGVGGGGLAGRVTTRVYSDSAEGGTGLGGNGTGKSGGGDGLGGRNIEQLRRVFDRNKGKLTRIYLREVKKDPTLEGTVVLNLVIEPSGAVSQCKVVSSELNNKRLEGKITSRCKMFDFGAEDVKTTKVNFPVSFLPY